MAEHCWACRGWHKPGEPHSGPDRDRANAAVNPIPVNTSKQEPVNTTVSRKQVSVNAPPPVNTDELTEIDTQIDALIGKLADLRVQRRRLYMRSYMRDRRSNG